jgi:hypothetical protein
MLSRRRTKLGRWNLRIKSKKRLGEHRSKGSKDDEKGGTICSANINIGR